MNQESLTIKDLESIVEKLEVKSEVSKRASALIDSFLAVEPDIRVKPATLAASALYISCVLSNNLITQSEVSQAAGISPGTLRTCCKRMASALLLK